jgi:hypothetical protein
MQYYAIPPVYEFSIFLQEGIQKYLYTNIRSLISVLFNP